MKWYGFITIFLVSSFFCNMMISVRMDYINEDTLVRQNIPLPESRLKLFDSAGNEELSAQTLPKEPAILFFFASWCRPCRMEMPEIVRLSKRKDVPFIGVAVRDKPEKLTEFLRKTGNPFDMIALDPQVDWAEKLNADKLPTALILNGKGTVVAIIRGFVTEEYYLKTILPFIQELKNEESR